MPRSPTSSEDEMAQSFSDDSGGSETDSSKEETIYDSIRARAEKPGGARVDESQASTLVIRVVIPDLQQTVSWEPCVPLLQPSGWHAAGWPWSQAWQAWPVPCSLHIVVPSPCLPVPPAGPVLSLRCLWLPLHTVTQHLVRAEQWQLRPVLLRERGEWPLRSAGPRAPIPSVWGVLGQSCPLS